MASFDVSQQWAQDGAEDTELRTADGRDDRPSGAHPVACDRREELSFAGQATPGGQASVAEASEPIAEQRLPEPQRTPSGIYKRHVEVENVAPTLLPPAGIDLRGAVEAFENNLIRQALERTHWNKNQAAKLLGLNRTTLVEMLKRKGIKAA